MCTSFVVSVLLCFVREQMRKNQTKREKKQRKKRIEKRPKNLLSRGESAKRKQEETSFSLYLYAHIIKNRECT